ncbi:MAG: class I SAM-dependent methyltransferase [Chloroflexia bacterium]|nr:class I SAM-dependent methyltransferase [Chloroflexia bacterium]
MDLPPPVQEAKALASRLSLASKCSDEAGALLRVLAAARPGGRIGVVGAGCGTGTAWLLSGCAPETRLFSVERHPERADAVREMFAAEPRMTVLRGDWELIAADAPFDVLFVDAVPPKHQFPDRIPPLVAPGGLVVLDDLTPLVDDDERRAAAHDPVRAFWYGLSGWAVTEVIVSPREAVLLAARLVTPPATA